MAVLDRFYCILKLLVLENWSHSVVHEKSLNSTLLCLYEPCISRTTDRDSRCFYPCEIILSHISVSAHGKDKNEQSHIGCTSIHDVIVMLKTPPCRISANSGFSGSLFSCFYAPNLGKVEGAYCLQLVCVCVCVCVSVRPCVCYKIY